MEMEEFSYMSSDDSGNTWVCFVLDLPRVDLPDGFLQFLMWVLKSKLEYFLGLFIYDDGRKIFFVYIFVFVYV